MNHLRDRPVEPGSGLAVLSMTPVSGTRVDHTETLRMKQVTSTRSLIQCAPGTSPGLLMFLINVSPPTVKLYLSLLRKRE